MSYDYSAKSITVNDFPNICRTCFCETYLSPISDMAIGGVTASELLSYCVEIERGHQDELPSNLCAACVNELYKIYEFKRQCQSNEAILKLIIENASNIHLETQDEDNKVEFDPIACNITVIEHDTDDGRLEEEEEEEDMEEEADKLDIKGEMISSHSSLKQKLKSRWKDPRLKKYACQVCNRMFTNSKMRQHARSHTKEKPFQCKICFQSFSLSGNLKRHVMTHTGERPHVCTTCGKGFIQATSLKNHIKTHDSEEHSKIVKQRDSDSRCNVRFSCNICGRSFKRSAPFNVHLERHALDDDASVKKEDPQEGRDYICDICHRGYKTKHLLKAHRLIHGEKSFLCSDCGKGFTTKASLDSHLRVHTGEKPHTCVICRKSFGHVGSFASHMLIHSGLKPHSCKFCPKSFTQLSHLTYHLRTHSGEKPYTCTYCGKCFALKGNLTVHTRTHTGETPFLCNVCGKGFYDSSSMKKHTRNQHKDDH